MGHSIEVRLTISGKHLMFSIFLATVVLKAMVLAKASCKYLQKQIAQFFWRRDNYRSDQLPFILD